VVVPFKEVAHFVGVDHQSAAGVQLLLGCLEAGLAFPNIEVALHFCLQSVEVCLSEGSQLAHIPSCVSEVILALGCAEPLHKLQIRLQLLFLALFALFTSIVDLFDQLCSQVFLLRLQELVSLIVARLGALDVTQVPLDVWDETIHCLV
jgi:hypothetical protein